MRACLTSLTTEPVPANYTGNSDHMHFFMHHAWPVQLNTIGQTSWGCRHQSNHHFCVFRIPPEAGALARLSSLKSQEKQKPSIKPSGGVLSFLHRLRLGRGTGLNRVANRAPSNSRPSTDSHNAWQALSETSGSVGSEDARVRSVLTSLTAHITGCMCANNVMLLACLTGHISYPSSCASSCPRLSHAEGCVLCAVKNGML